MFKFKKLGAMEIGQIAALIILYIATVISVLFLAALSVIEREIRYAMIAFVIAWAIKKSNIFDVTVDLEEV